ncbi:MAG TPA: hypothetical protein VHX16_08790 [Chloroflexota bacterium]|jgi:hypothetical protein|nr:hypothetical protein [Chloroflexota bacterium]
MPDELQSKAEDLMNINDTVILRNLPVGTKVSIRGGAVAEVTANPEDGGWIYVKYLESPSNPSKVGEEELVFCTDVLKVV